MVGQAKKRNRGAWIPAASGRGGSRGGDGADDEKESSAAARVSRGVGSMSPGRKRVRGVAAPRSPDLVSSGARDDDGEGTGSVAGGLRRRSSGRRAGAEKAEGPQRAGGEEFEEPRRDRAEARKGKEEEKVVEKEKVEEEEKQVGVHGGSEVEPRGLSDRGGVRNREKVLVLSSRGIIYRFRHLMEDVLQLLPHCKKDSKFDMAKGDSLSSALCELADLRGCSSCLFFETRKKQDLYLWVSKVPNGPSAKFHVSAVHTMTELKLVGNHLKGSRPVLSFSPSFDRLPHLQLLKELFTQIFGTPRGHRKSKPFFDHVHSFTFLDNHIWFRNYQVVLPGWEGSEEGKLEKHMLEKMTLAEVGPRFCLNPIRIFAGSFGGPTLFENPLFVSPNSMRAAAKSARSMRYNIKVKAKQRRKEHERINRLVPDELDNLWKEDFVDDL